jgi:von Willebrand factor type A domain
MCRKTRRSIEGKEGAMVRFFRGCLLLLPALAIAGCNDLSSSTPTTAQPQSAPAANSPPGKLATKQPAAKTPAASNRKGDRPSVAELQKELDVIARAYDASRSKFHARGTSEEAAVKKIGAEILASVELGPTLVVWFIDQTPSAQRLAQDVIAAAKEVYDSPDLHAAVRGSAASDKPLLLTSVVGISDQVQFALDPPSADFHAVKDALDGLREVPSGREMVFTAIKQALDKYLPLRTRERREVLFVVVTDEAGDDGALVDQVAELARKNAIPVYAIGSPAPWGQTNPLADNPKVASSKSDDDSTPTYGPESRFSERVDLDSWGEHGPTAQIGALVDSGFGPFALEKLCRESRGRFLAIRGEGSGSQAVAQMFWPSGSELRFAESAVSKYVPDYVSEADYRKLLAENKCRAALHEAAKLPLVKFEGSPVLRFPKGTEAKVAKQTSQAQQFAARNLPGLDRLLGILSPAEADRDKLTGPRWQAEFDVAIGRVLANKARLDGYNSMIAALKRGKTFQNTSSDTWLLEPADSFETESTIKRMGERAKMYLERVDKEHPGTPWAAIAEEELKTPLGWTWKES